MQVAPGFFLQRAINAAADQGVEITLIDNRLHFFLSYHLKGVCNSHCGGRNSNHIMSQS